MTNQTSLTSGPDGRLEQIAKIAQNARPSWFGLLALLFFIGVTLMGHEDSTFFAVGAETKLPLVGISVPTVSFFIAAPVLTAALYVYLHIYLDGLWVALAKCPARMDRGPVEEHVYPAMLCTAALAVRRYVRSEFSKPVEGSRARTVATSVLMVWLLGPIVLGVLWWRSMPYHEVWLTLWAAFWLWLTLVAAQRSIARLFNVMRHGTLAPDRPHGRAFAAFGVTLSTGLLAFAAFVSWATTESGWFFPLVPASLAGTELSHKRADWLHYDMWLEEWEHAFRVREGLALTGSDEWWTDETRDQFQYETAQRWATLTQSLDSPDLKARDFRKASLRAAFLSGADLRETRFERANLIEARFEGADLREAGFEDANLSRARLEGADLRGARFKGANCFEVRLDGANLRNVRFEHVDFHGARFEGANLSGAQFQRTILTEARFERAELINAQFKHVDLINARFEHADLRGARFEDADIRGARFDGANLEGAEGLTQPQLDTACGDQRTRLPEGFSIPMCDDNEE